MRFHFSFGKRSAGSLRRGCECIVLEASEMIVVSYTVYVCAIRHVSVRWGYSYPVSVSLRWTTWTTATSISKDKYLIDSPGEDSAR